MRRSILTSSIRRLSPIPYRSGDDWFVVAEADFLYLTDIVHDIKDIFDMETKGWYTLLEYQKKTTKSYSHLMCSRTIHSNPRQIVNTIRHYYECRV